MKPTAKPGAYRFRNRLPQPGEGKRPHAEVKTLTEGTVARIHLYDAIDSWGGYWGISAEEFVAALDTISLDVTEIRVHINSPGGEVYEAIAMANALRNHPASITAVIDGLAASAASYIAVTADEVVMGEDTEFMIHDPWAVAAGDAAAFREYAGHLDRVANNLAAAYARKASGSAEDWRAVMVAEQWYSAEETVAAGLADRVGRIETEGTAAEGEGDDDELTDDEIFAAALAALGAKHTSRADAGEPEKPAAAAEENGEADLAERRATAQRRMRQRSLAQRAR